MAGAGKTSRPRALGLGRDLLGLFTSLPGACKLHEGRGFDILFITASPALKTVPGQEQNPNKELLNHWLLPSPRQRST